MSWPNGHDMVKYKAENINNEHDNNNMIKRLEKLKNLRDNYISESNEFQQLLNNIKENNFNDRMLYIMNRIYIKITRGFGSK
jgi:hypothetical protein